MTEKLPKLAVELAKQGRALDAARDAHREDLRSLQRSSWLMASPTWPKSRVRAASY